jgi:hypothetical protein
MAFWWWDCFNLQNCGGGGSQMVCTLIMVENNYSYVLQCCMIYMHNGITVNNGLEEIVTVSAIQCEASSSSQSLLKITKSLRWNNDTDTV